MPPLSRWPPPAQSQEPPARPPWLLLPYSPGTRASNVRPQSERVPGARSRSRRNGYTVPPASRRSCPADRGAGGIAQRRLAGIVGADAWEDRLQLLQAVLGILLELWEVIRRGIGRRWRIGGSSMPARIIDQQPT